MKYIRKAIVLILVAVFIAAIAVGLSVVFAVRNINIIRVAYSVGGAEGGSEEFSSAVSSIEDGLSQYKGKTIVTVGEDDIAAVVAGSGYAELVSVEKIYPCTINVTVRERVEMFAVRLEDGSGYNMLDAACKPVATSPENANNADGSPNVLLEGVPAEDYSSVTGIAKLFEERFSSVRAFAESISVVSGAVGGDVMSIKLRCGLTMELRDYKSRTLEKAEALCDAFSRIDDSLKLGGTMYCVQTVSGNLSVAITGVGTV